jgi:threonine aldolase
MDAVINLRSDTQTLPTPEMRRAMAEAVVGDETYGEDPTVRRLEELACELLGTEAAMLTVSGTMANLVALMTHCRPCDEVFLDAEAHVLRNEAGGLARVAGVVPTVVPSHRGHLVPAALASAIREPQITQPSPRLVWLENTHNRGGGSVLPAEQQAAILKVVRARGLAVHLDGARVWNAAMSLGRRVDELVRGIDTVSVDLTKGLACPMGALLAGPAVLVEQARWHRRTVGGGMRQAGVIAACGIVALERHVDRLADDHAVARMMAEELATVDGYDIQPSEVETNMLFVGVARLGGAAAVTTALGEEGVLVSARPPHEIRMVTHLQVGETAAKETLERMRRVAARLRNG